MNRHKYCKLKAQPLSRTQLKQHSLWNKKEIIIALTLYTFSLNSITGQK